MYIRTSCQLLARRDLGMGKTDKELTGACLSEDTTKINDIISCRTGRSLPQKRNRVKRKECYGAIDL